MVSFESAQGFQNFRPLKGSAGEQANIKIAKYPTKFISFSEPRDKELNQKILHAIYMNHPYEEPIIQVEKIQESRAHKDFRKGGACDSSPHKWYKRKK